MTLIAAVRSAGGIAVAADAEESVGVYRRTVQKISPRTFGHLHVVIVGSGNADLIDSFIIRMHNELSSASISRLSEFVSFTETILANFYREDVFLCPEEPGEKVMHMLIGASLETSGEFDAWRSKNIRLERIGLYDLLGWDEVMYQSVIQRLISPTMSLQQAILASLYTIAIAKESAKYVGGITSMATIKGSGIRMEHQDVILGIEQYLNEYERKLNHIFLSCADTGLSPRRLHNLLEEFSQTASALHLKHIINTACQALVSTS